MDRLSLKNMHFYGYHGAYEAEKELGQHIEVDVDMYGDFSQSAKTDDVDLGISYIDVYTVVKDIVEEREFNLLEALAESIADQILDSYDVKKVVVRVRKPNAAVGGVIGAIEVEISRTVKSDVMS